MAVEYFQVPGVALFDAHESSDPKYPSVDASRIERIAANSQRRIDDTGDTCPITLGHTPRKGDNKPMPPVVGHVTRFYTRMIGNTNPRLAVCGDLEIRKDMQETLIKDGWRRRSAEVWPNDDIIDPVALLSAETPRRDLGLLNYERKFQGEPVRYAMSDDEPEQEGEDVAFDMGEFMQAFSASPYGKFLDEQMQAAESAKTAAAMAAQPAPAVPGAPPAAPVAAAPPAAPPVPSPTAPPKAKPDFPPKDEDKDGKMDYQRLSADDVARLSIEEQALHYRRSEAKYADFDKRLADLEADKLRYARDAEQAKRETRLKQLQMEGFDLEVAEELETVADFDAQKFERHLGQIRKKYTRAPVNAGWGPPGEIDINAGGSILPMNARKDDRPLTTEQTTAAAQYRKEKNCSVEEAIEYVRSKTA